MLTLKEARREAEEIVEGGFSIPSLSSLGNWRRWGCLSEPEEYENRGRNGGRIGLYDDTLPIQIAVAAQLKRKYDLPKIGEIAQKVRENLTGEETPEQHNALVEEIVESFFINEDVEEARKTQEKAKNESDPEEVKRLKKDFENRLEAIKRKELTFDYINVWDKYEERYEKDLEKV